MLRTILIAPNAFKRSLTATQAADAITAGVRIAVPTATILQLPVADGGDGTAEVLVQTTRGQFVAVDGVIDPLGTPRRSRFGILGDGITGIVEMAEASGLRLVPTDRLNPMVATSYGTGQLIRACLDRGCRKIIVGLGGSATVDGGAGMVQALGGRLLDASEQAIGYGSAGLATLTSIDLSRLDARLREVELVAACDVTTPLVGPAGAAYVFGPQKGATPDMLPILDHHLTHLAAIIERDTGLSIADLPGGGAAGGCGAAIRALLGGRLEPGIMIVLAALHFEDHLRNADLVITGEGQIDAGTAQGKAIAGVAALAAQHDIPVIALAGSIHDDTVPGLSGVYPLVDGPMSLDDAITGAAELLERATVRALRLVQTGLKLSPRSN